MSRGPVLITGTSSGFGLRTAVALSKKGYTVYATMRNLEKKDALLKACAEARVSVNVRLLDVTKPETIAEVVEEMERSNGPEVLINNAGFGFGGFFEDTSNANFAEQFATNFYGALNCTRAVLPGMRKREKGLILNVSSQSGRSGLPALSAYTASKFAMEGWAESLRYEVKRFGIYVVLLEPGVYKTEICSEGKRKTGDNARNPRSPYYWLYSSMEQGSLRYMEKYGQNPQKVANKIVKIVGTPCPRLRYTIGVDVAIENFLKFLLPSRPFEKLNEIFIEKCGME